MGKLKENEWIDLVAKTHVHVSKDGNTYRWLHHTDIPKRMRISNMTEGILSIEFKYDDGREPKPPLEVLKSGKIMTIFTVEERCRIWAISMDLGEDLCAQAIDEMDDAEVISRHVLKIKHDCEEMIEEDDEVRKGLLLHAASKIIEDNMCN